MQRLAAALVGALAVALTAAGVAAAQPLSGAAILKRLNAERARLGMYAHVHEVRAWSEKCSRHNRWMRLNHILSHYEIPGTKGYSRGGNWAGSKSVLSYDDSWASGNPWADAPLHLIQVLNPDLRRTGVSDAFGSSCMTTWPGIDGSVNSKPLGTPLEDHVWTLPRDGGRISRSQRALELPFTPQQKVGIRAGALTGPYLYVWATSDQLRSEDAQGRPDPITGELLLPPEAHRRPLAVIAGGSVVGPDGRRVRTKAIDNQKVDGLAGAGNGWLLPVRPLKPRTRYRATVVLRTAEREPWEDGEDRRVTHTWTFTTTGR